MRLSKGMIGAVMMGSIAAMSLSRSYNYGDSMYYPGSQTPRPHKVKIKNTKRARVRRLARYHRRINKGARRRMARWR